MDIKHIVTINFTDAETGGQAGAVVRAWSKGVILALYHETDGDLEINISIENAKELYDAIGQGIKIAAGG